MTKWLLTMHLMCASKKGMSAHQLHRMTGLPYKTAWFMAHRIREGMRELNPTPMGGEGKSVEIDEIYIGGKEGGELGALPVQGSRKNLKEIKRQVSELIRLSAPGSNRSRH